MRFVVPSLIGVALIVGVLIVLRGDRSPTPTVPVGPQLQWVYEAPHPGSVVASPCVTSEAVFVAATRTGGNHLSGALYAIDPTTGKLKWTFDDNGNMLPTASTPILVNGRLVFGEGMHANFTSRLYGIDPANGHKHWEFKTNDHVEGGPAVVGDAVVFPAGNDGLYALDVLSGTLKWNFRADLHIDSTPSVRNDRAYVGSGKSRRFQDYQVVCLDAKSGQPIWRTPVDLPAWGSPVVTKDRLFVGLGNGRLTESAPAPDKPSGALACFDPVTGKSLWTFRTGDAVFGRPAIVDDRVVFGSRDGNLYGLALDGTEIFRVPMEAPVVAGVVAANGFAYGVSVAGRLVCLDPADGREQWRQEIGRPGIEPLVFAAPVIVNDRLYVAAEMASGNTGIVTLFCFELPPGQRGRS